MRRVAVKVPALGPYPGIDSAAVKVTIWGPEWMTERELTTGEWAQLSELLQLDPVPDHNVIVGVDVTVKLDVI